jgi:predicted phosphodiesterase
MPIAAIYDVHGNLPALEAVIDEVRRASVDRLVIGGDVLPGPMPRETLEYLLGLEIPAQYIHGNGDREVLTVMRGQEPVTVPAKFQGVVRWTAEQLTADHERVIAGWPPVLRMQVSGIGDVLFCHATPRNDTEIFTRLTPEDRLLSIFGSVDASVAVCGHTHMQFDRTVGRLRVVNAGSVGMPVGEPGADWLLLGPDIQLRHTRYDLAVAAERILRSRYPQAEDFAAHNVLNPPSEAAMLDAFGRAERGGA